MTRMKKNEFNIRRSSVTSIFNIMERGGWITRERVHEDARLKKMVLTEKPYEIEDILFHKVDKLEEKIVADISEEDFHILETILEKYNVEFQLCNILLLLDYNIYKGEITMTCKEIIKRYVFLICGLFVMALGVIFSVKATLGISPIASLPYVLSEIISSISLGMFTFFINVIFLIIQFILLQREIKIACLLQIPISLFFGYFEDFWMMLLTDLNPFGYIQEFIFMLLGCLFTAMGVSMLYTANVAMDSLTALLKVVSDRFHFPFGKVKITNDVTFVAIAIILSFFLLHRVTGIREGTIIAAFLTGAVAGVINKRLTFMNQFFTAGESNSNTRTGAL